MSLKHKPAVPRHAASGNAATTATAAVASGKNDHSGAPVSVESIRLCAYQKWESAGKPTGDGIAFWLEAEHELVPVNQAEIDPALARTS